MTATTGLSDLWAKAWNDEDFRFQIKAQDVSVTLARALADSGMTKAALAASLGWKPSRVSRVLSGGGNLTLRTIHDLTTALGLDFDLVLRRPDQQRAPQPWEAHALLDDVVHLHRTAQSNVTQTKELLDTALLLNRRSWQLARNFNSRTASATAMITPKVSNG